MCGAKGRRSGLPCRRPKAKGRSRCPLHGGKSLVGVDNPAYKHGRFSKVLHKNLLNVYEESRNDPELLDCREEVAVVTAVMVQTCERAAVGDFNALWDEMRTCVKGYMGEARKAEASQVILTGFLDRLFNLVLTGQSVARANEELVRLAEKRTAIAARESRRQVEMAALFTVEQVAHILAVLSDAMKRHVQDPSAIQQITNEFDAAFSGTVVPKNGERK